MTAANPILRPLVWLLPCLAVGAIATDAHSRPDERLATELQLASSAFVSQQDIPAAHTCEGDNVSPALRWSQVPSEAQSMVLIVDDPDAGHVVTHWVLYNVPPSAGELREGVTSSQLPSGTGEGQSDWQTFGYIGPCPPDGRHHYHFKMYALDTVLTGLNAPTRQQVEAAMQGHVLASGELIGTYELSGNT